MSINANGITQTGEDVRIMKRTRYEYQSEERLRKEVKQ
ncbi:MAG: hypothetical protein ACI8RD_013646 [Bacillariaceae sp.]|jgi:hypothetical protein